MAVDASIYNLVRQPQPLPNPMAMAGQAMQLRQMMGQNELQGLQTQQIRDQTDRQQKIRDLMKTGNVTPEQIMAIDPEAGLQYQGNVIKQRKSEADLMKTDRENLMAFADESRKVLPTITPERWPLWRDQQIQRAGMFQTDQMRQVALEKAMAIPEQYDPEFIRNSVVKAEELFTPKPTQVNMPDGSIKTVDMNPFTNPQAGQFQADRAMKPADEARLGEAQASNLQQERIAAAKLYDDTGIRTPPRDVTIGQPAQPIAQAPTQAPAAPAQAPAPRQAPGVPQAPVGLSPKQQRERVADIAEAAPRERARYQMVQDRGKTVLRDIGRALAQADKAGRIAGTLAMRRSLSGNQPLSATLSPAYELQQHLESIKSNISIDQLQLMREASPTGGALGQIPVRQQEYLMSVLGSLLPTLKPDVLRENLHGVGRIYANAMYGSDDERAAAVQRGVITQETADEWRLLRDRALKEIDQGAHQNPQVETFPLGNEPPDLSGYKILED